MVKSARQPRQPRNKRQKQEESFLTLDQYDLPLKIHASPKAFEAKTAKQAQFKSAIEAHDLTFGLGPAGTGKTHVPVTLAAEALLAKTTKKIIITRPAVEAGESIGFLPGEMDEKFDPYFAPVRAILEKKLGAGTVEYMIKAGKIVAQPMAFLRGVTFEDAWIILDEAQNTTPVQMKLFLTRIGENAKVIINGDLEQKDIPGPSGLKQATELLRGLKSVGIVEFSREDIVRSGLVRAILDRYADYNKKEDNENTSAESAAEPEPWRNWK